MKRFWGLIVIALILGTTGCKKEDPNPELLDPIFKDLEKRATEAQKSLDEEVAKQKELKEKLGKQEPNTIDLKNVQKELAKSQMVSLQMQQAAKYYKIRAERRKLVGRLAYKDAFAKGEAWPDPREYSDYLVNIRLRQVSLNWSARVPKLQTKADMRAPAAKEAKSEGETPKSH